MKHCNALESDDFLVPPTRPQDASRSGRESVPFQRETVKTDRRRLLQSKGAVGGGQRARPLCSVLN